MRVSCLLPLLTPLSARSASEVPYARELAAGRAVVQQLIDSAGIPGLAVTVAADGKVLWSAGYGFADLENGVAQPRGR